MPGQSADWWDYHQAPVRYRKHGRPVPQRWHGKVLACTDATATARQVVEWYEVRWQIEIFFRELKSRMQFGCYVLQKFEAAVNDNSYQGWLDSISQAAKRALSMFPSSRTAACRCRRTG